ncbi:MAG TPA: prepilin-type N-terminal cleavage/methylation domain-containing protein [Pyrinomonadaceae bacterium]|nr:prepilin-type N-terminal cleavage/methylation domain-containing protein [Pyrinomonadaceae bacterium]
MTTRAKTNSLRTAEGFSLLELLIAMTITLAVMAAASTLLATSLRIRTRENARSDALAAAQRALHIMSREIGNSGYGLTDNGIVIADSGTNSIRVRANINNNNTLADPDEDVRYIYQAANNAIVRFDSFPAPTGSTVVLARRIDSLTLTYWDVNGVQITDPANYGLTERITIDVRVNLPAGPEQPATVVRLASDIALRNAPITLQRF